MGSGSSQGLPVTLRMRPIGSPASQLPPGKSGTHSSEGRLPTQAEGHVLAIWAGPWHTAFQGVWAIPAVGLHRTRFLGWETPLE